MRNSSPLPSFPGIAVLVRNDSGEIYILRRVYLSTNYWFSNIRLKKYEGCLNLKAIESKDKQQRPRTAH